MYILNEIKKEYHKGDINEPKKMKLPLNTKYIVIDKKYIPLEQSAGAYCCDNCGKLIANIATVKSDKVYNIGFDCLENILLNNSLLSSLDIDDYNKVKKMIPKVLNFAKKIKEKINKNSGVTGILFERTTHEFYTFYWLQNNKTESRDNDYQKIKDMNFDFLIETLKNIFPKIQILTN